MERRTIHEVIDSLSKHVYKRAKQYLRNTTYRSMSAKDDGEGLFVIDVAISHEG